MDIDRYLDRMISADLDEWKARKHEATFSAEGGQEEGGPLGVTVGSLYVDGQPLRAMSSGRSAWVTLTEATHVAARLGVPLQMV